MYKNSRNGFTLIELLVVIAIIGILSAVVLASLGTARDKGDDAGVLENIHTIATQAAVYESNHNQDYGSFNDGSGNAAPCPVPGTTGSSVFHDPTVENAIAAAVLDSAGGASFCQAEGPEYAVSVNRPPGVVNQKSYFWCTDSTGAKCGNDGNSGDGATPIVANACVPCTVNN